MTPRTNALKTTCPVEFRAEGGKEFRVGEKNVEPEFTSPAATSLLTPPAGVATKMPLETPCVPPITEEANATVPLALTLKKLKPVIRILPPPVPGATR